MIVQSFRSVMWVGAVAAAALGCYMVSLRVASERATLEDVETAILMAKRDIRALDTELSTRGRLRQLERWNNDVLALTAPTEGQFLEGETQLAGLGGSIPKSDAPVRLAAAPSRKKDGGDNEPILATYRPRGPDREELLVRAAAPAAPARAKSTVKKPKVAVKSRQTTGKNAAGSGPAKIAAGTKAKAAKAL